MRYSIEPGDRINVKGYGFLSFAKNMGKNLSNKYSQKLFDSAKKSATDAIKTASKRAIQKTTETTGDLIGSKIADKITSISKKPVKELPNIDGREEENVEKTTHKNRYVSPEEKQQIIEVVYSAPTLDNLLEAQRKIVYASACIPIFIIFFAYNLIIKSINKAHTKLLNLYTFYSSTRFSRVGPLYTTLKY